MLHKQLILVSICTVSDNTFTVGTNLAAYIYLFLIFIRRGSTFTLRVGLRIKYQR